MSPGPKTGFVNVEWKVGQRPEEMHTPMHIQCSFTAYPWPRLLLGGPFSSKDPEFSVPHVGSQVIVCLLDYGVFLDSRLCEGSHRGMPGRCFTAKLKVWGKVFPSSFPLIHSPFLCSLFLKDKCSAYVTGANGCQCVYNLISQNQSVQNSCTFSEYTLLQCSPHCPVPMLGFWAIPDLSHLQSSVKMWSWGNKKMAKPLLRPINLEITAVFLCSLKVCLTALLCIADHLDLGLKETQGSFKQPAPWECRYIPIIPPTFTFLW